MPAGAGGGTDTMARAIASGLKEVRPDLEFQVVNRPSGAGAVGYAYMSQQAGNPMEVMAVESGVVTVPIATDSSWDYTDFTPIGQVSAHLASVAVAADRFDGFSDLADTLNAGTEPMVLGIAGSEDAQLNPLLTALLARFEEEFGPVSRHDVIR